MVAGRLRPPHAPFLGLIPMAGPPLLAVARSPALLRLVPTELLGYSLRRGLRRDDDKGQIDHSDWYMKREQKHLFQPMFIRRA
jgi:hypothetical protein